MWLTAIAQSGYLLFGGRACLGGMCHGAWLGVQATGACLAVPLFCFMKCPFACSASQSAWTSTAVLDTIGISAAQHCWVCLGAAGSTLLCVLNQAAGITETSHTLDWHPH
jgi:hypothetical protein